MNIMRTFSFGPFQLIPERQLLLQDESAVRIGGRAFDLLTALVERPGELLSKHELMDRAWPTTTVDEGNLKVNMAALRRVLDDDADDARYIATVTGRGYRFVAPIEAGDPAASPGAARRGRVRNHNLPCSTTRIFGRADTIRAMRAELDEARLVSILGPGGVGKTTVALAVAHQLVEARAHGAWLVDLAETDDRTSTPATVAQAIASALGAPVDREDPLSTLCDHLRDRELLLVLDNCEHVVDAAADCASRLLAEIAGVTILATSREPLLVRGERVRRLPSLPVPPAGVQLRAEEALAFPAIELFVDRAADKLESFHLTDADATLAGEICRRLDGLPLAIEMAAARIDSLGMAGLLAHLAEGFDLCVGRRSDPERHRTLSAMLDWSYSRLDGEEARVLRAVSAFTGPFDDHDAALVADVEINEVADMLARLAAKSLLVTRLEAGTVSYYLFETTRAYCTALLEVRGEAAAARRRQAERERGARKRRAQATSTASASSARRSARSPTLAR